MPGLYSSRSLLLSVPLALLVAACQFKAAAPPGLGDAQPPIGQPPVVEEAAAFSDRCTPEQFEAVRTCEGPNTGSECDPEANVLIPPTGNYATPPELTWTFPCNPDSYRVELYMTNASGSESVLLDVETADYDPELGGPARSWDPGGALPVAHRYSYVIQPFLNDASPPEGIPGVIPFWTGPLCNGPVSAYLVPTLDEPLNNKVLFYPEGDASSDPIRFHWWAVTGPACLPMWEGQVSTDPSFSTSVIPIQLSSPMTVAGIVDWTRCSHVTPTTGTPVPG